MVLATSELTRSAPRRPGGPRSPTNSISPSLLWPVYTSPSWGPQMTPTSWPRHSANPPSASTQFNTRASQVSCNTQTLFRIVQHRDFAETKSSYFFLGPFLVSTWPRVSGLSRTVGGGGRISGLGPAPSPRRCPPTSPWRGRTRHHIASPSSTSAASTSTRPPPPSSTPASRATGRRGRRRTPCRAA